jgi:hypothetical protein
MHNKQLHHLKFGQFGLGILDDTSEIFYGVLIIPGTVNLSDRNKVY